MAFDKTTYAREYGRKRRQDPVYRQKQSVAKKKWYANLTSEEREKRKIIGRDYNLKYNYGIAQKDYEALLFIQGGTCACCPATSSAKGHLHIDHCHVTGRVRGLLCDGCNQTLGNVGESVSRLHALISYLERY